MCGGIYNTFKEFFALRACVCGGSGIIAPPFPQYRNIFAGLGAFLIIGPISLLRKHAVLINFRRNRYAKYFIINIGGANGDRIRIFTAQRNLAIHLLI